MVTLKGPEMVKNGIGDLNLVGNCYDDLSQWDFIMG